MHSLETLISAAYDTLMRDRSPEHREPLTADTVLIGPTGVLDSLEVVSLLLDIEERIKELTGRGVSLADEKAFSQEHSPFRSVNALCDYLHAQLEAS